MVCVCWGVGCERVAYGMCVLERGGGCEKVGYGMCVCVCVCGGGVMRCERTAYGVCV